MSVLVRFNPASLTKEQYEESVRRLREAGYSRCRPRLSRLLWRHGEAEGHRKGSAVTGG